MMTREMIPSLYVPVLIGHHRAIARTARRLFWHYGLISHSFSSRPTLLHHLTPWVICHSLPHAAESLRALALSDFADEILRADRQPLLFLCSTDSAEWSDDTLASLECRYLILHASSPIPPFILSPEGEQTI